MNKAMLEAEMKLYGDSGTSLAKYLDIARCTLSVKMNCKDGAEFTQGEISKIKERYNLSAEKVDLIFFNNEVS